jgi:hypothetical protein
MRYVRCRKAERRSRVRQGKNRRKAAGIADPPQGYPQEREAARPARRLNKKALKFQHIHGASALPFAHLFIILSRFCTPVNAQSFEDSQI